MSSWSDVMSKLDSVGFLVPLFFYLCDNAMDGGLSILLLAVTHSNPCLGNGTRKYNEERGGIFINFFLCFCLLGGSMPGIW